MGNKITIQLVDDYELVRTGLKYVLEKDRNLSVVVESSEVVKAINDFFKKMPDVVLMSLNMEGVSSLSLVERMLTRYPSIRIIMVNGLHSQSAVRAMDAGAKGFLSKGAPSSEILLAIRNVMAGKRYIDRETAQQMAMTQLQGDDDPLKILSAREYEIFLHLAKGIDIKTIAEEHYLSPKTVRSHKANIMQKLGLNNTVEFVCFAMKRGVIDCACETKNQ